MQLIDIVRVLSPLIAIHVKIISFVYQGLEIVKECAWGSFLGFADALENGNLNCFEWNYGILDFSASRLIQISVVKFWGSVKFQVIVSLLTNCFS